MFWIFACYVNVGSTMKIQAIILAGGRGTRLAPLTDNLPKPLVLVGGRPMIYYVLDQLKAHGITRVAVSISYLGGMIVDELGDGSDIGMQISYLVEETPMGTGGWSKLVDWDELDERFLVVNADNLFWIDVGAFLARHDKHEAVATIAAIEIPTDAHRAYEVLLHHDDGERLLDYVDRGMSEEIIKSRNTVFVSSGWYIMTPDVRRFVPDQDIVSNEGDLWPALAGIDDHKGFYHATEPWFDSGTHERIARIEDFLANR